MNTDKKIIKGLIFDMDGLIFDSERIVQRAWNIVGEKLGYGQEFGNHIYNTIGFNVNRREVYFRENVDKEFPMERFTIESRNAFHEIIKNEGVLIKRGAVELMDYAKEQGYKMAVATSSRREHAERLLKDNGIYQYFDAKVYGDMVKYSKPNPEIYLKACEGIEEEPKLCIALEDSPAGILSARAAGLTSVMIPDLVKVKDDELVSDYIFDDLFCVKELLQDWK